MNIERYDDGAIRRALKANIIRQLGLMQRQARAYEISLDRLLDALVQTPPESAPLKTLLLREMFQAKAVAEVTDLQAEITRLWVSVGTTLKLLEAVEARERSEWPAQEATEEAAVKSR